ncbi:hypothetical protein E4U31_007197 [Claviceps sp. LM219 group G6]|nr:hypothetical protein E4U31_007197 [Claviceps sp. LM219 group G6]
MESTRTTFVIPSTFRGCQFLSFDSLYSASQHVICIVLLCLIFNYLAEFAISRPTRVKVPVLGYRCMLEPTWFVRLRFVWTGGSIVRDGYERFRSSIFQIRKLGTDIVIIPPNYIDEVRKLSKDKTRSVEPFIDDFAGKYTHGMTFLQSDLQNIVIQKKLTPRLAQLTTAMQEELDIALSLEMPTMTEYLEPLRQEMIIALADGGWQKTTLNRLYKLDSLLKESQRLSPVFLLTFNRIFHEPINLSDGTHLPSGTRIAVPSHAMLQDPLHVPGQSPPAEFDAFRYSALREESDAKSKYHFSMTDSSNMAFGYGKYACPGRFYASNEMKIVLTTLLLRYDFKFRDGEGRPKNITIDSDMFPDPRARLCVRLRSPVN